MPRGPPWARPAPSSPPACRQHRSSLQRLRATRQANRCQLAWAHRCTAGAGWRPHARAAGCPLPGRGPAAQHASAWQVTRARRASGACVALPRMSAAGPTPVQDSNGHAPARAAAAAQPQLTGRPAWPGRRRTPAPSPAAGWPHTGEPASGPQPAGRPGILRPARAYPPARDRNPPMHCSASRLRPAGLRQLRSRNKTCSPWCCAQGARSDQGGYGGGGPRSCRLQAALQLGIAQQPGMPAPEAG